MNEFLKVLEWDLGRGVSGRTDSLLSQSMYFGLSFSRIGADFRPLIVPVFVRVTVDVYQRALRSAKHRYDIIILSLSVVHRHSLCVCVCGPFSETITICDTFTSPTSLTKL